MSKIANESPRAIKHILKVEIIHMFVEHLILKNEHFFKFLSKFRMRITTLLRYISNISQNPFLIVLRHIHKYYVFKYKHVDVPFSISDNSVLGNLCCMFCNKEHTIFQYQTLQHKQKCYVFK